jgi:hypothetical protein
MAEVETTLDPSPGLSQSGPILVTGIQRSGTTWIGRMLSLSHGVTYLGEPLNPYIPGPLLSLERKYQYTYICEANERRYLQAFEALRSFEYPFLRELRAARSAANVLRVGKRGALFAAARLRGARALIKDPFAFFSAPWLARRLGCRVVVCVRHPGAVAGSMQRLNWGFDFGHLLDQPLLMADMLAPFEGEIRAAARRPDDVVGQASLLWKLVYATADRFRAEFPEFVVVRHEDLSSAPVKGFESLYRDLGIDFDARAAETIREFSDERNPREQQGKQAKAVRLNSRAAAETWRARLTESDRERIRDATAGVIELFYPDEGSKQGQVPGES